MVNDEMLDRRPPCLVVGECLTPNGSYPRYLETMKVWVPVPGSPVKTWISQAHGRDNISAHTFNKSVQ